MAHPAAAQRDEYRDVQLAHLLGADVYDRDEYDGAEFHDPCLRHVRVVGPAQGDAVAAAAHGFRGFTGRGVVCRRARSTRR